MAIKKNKNGKFTTKNNFSDLENDKYVMKWLENIKSKEQRLSLMDKFCAFLNKTPSELAIEHQNDFKNDILERSNIAKKQLNAFFGYLTNTNDKKWKNTLNNKTIKKPLAWNSARQYVYSKLLSFYSRLGIPIKYSKTEKPNEQSKNVRSKVWRENGDMISKVEKKSILKKIRDSFNSIRDKAIFLGKLSSALDSVDLFNLRIRDFNEGYMKKMKLCYLQGNRQKDGMLYQTFFGSESCNMIKLYLNDRLDKINKNRNEKLTKIPESEYLFTAIKHKNEENKESTRMVERYFTEKIKKIVIKLNLGNITPKSLRRFFETYLKQNSIPVYIVKRLMGHKGEMGDIAYDQMFNNAKEGEYEEIAIYFNDNIDPLISLGNGNGKITKIDERVKNLTETIKIISEENKSKNEELTDLKETMNKQKQLVETMEESIKTMQKNIKTIFEDKESFLLLTRKQVERTKYIGEEIIQEPTSKQIDRAIELEGFEERRIKEKRYLEELDKEQSKNK